MPYPYKRITVNGKRVRYHRYLWEQFYGPIPEGYCIHHKDGNKLNNNIDNLECILLNEHSKIHSRGENNGFFKKHHTKKTISRISRKVIVLETNEIFMSVQDAIRKYGPGIQATLSEQKTPYKGKYTLRYYKEQNE